MHRVIDHVLRIVESMNVEIDLDPIVVVDLIHVGSEFGKALATPAVRRQISRASLAPSLGWWNGRHVRLRGVCRKACGFKSRPEHHLSIGRKIQETSARASGDPS